MMRKFLFFTVLAISFVSCDSDDEDMSEFKMAKAKWEKLQFEDYTIQENLWCFCGGLLEWTTKVVNNEKDTVYFDESKLYDGQTYQMVFEGAKTIDEAFDFIENFNTKKVASFIVEYDEQFGFPKSIAIDYIENAVDDEITYVFSNFTPTK
ncbi:DUF6174 domain-containing protein [Aureibaculum sp. 2210JD6-5]|uniref:DUF6174 domain-containing protein n=1 Tax=Aureibaculum sp. 2210JD6-5 TaxID=3103957 RepID=UPI002AACDC80|nr:DUF6174 domain-containing protein [Aureibaculum sp. 2210JD6-5]MDY7396156.1 DUF6174 domain-containing protein [Aureibaculum sp. 2210JD6-5]